MRFLTRYTPTDAPKGSPSPETMAKMKNFTEECIKSGVLIATAGSCRTPRTECESSWRTARSR